MPLRPYLEPAPSDPPPDPQPAPAPELTPEDHARLAWPWLKVRCAPSTWAAFVASVGVRAPEVKTWPTA